MKKNNVLRFLISYLFIMGLAFAAYSYLWHRVAEEVKAAYIEAEPNGMPLRITGYPGPIKAYLPEYRHDNGLHMVHIQNIQATSWLLPKLPIHIRTGPLTIKAVRWNDSISFDSFNADFTTDGKIYDVTQATVRYQDFIASVRGQIDTAQKPLPKFDLLLRFENHNTFVVNLAEKKILDPDQALLTSTMLSALAGPEGAVEMPLTQKGQTLYLGLLPLFTLPIVAPYSATDSLPNQGP